MSPGGVYTRSFARDPFRCSATADVRGSEAAVSAIVELARLEIRRSIFGVFRSACCYLHSILLTPHTPDNFAHLVISAQFCYGCRCCCRYCSDFEKVAKNRPITGHHGSSRAPVLSMILRKSKRLNEIRLFLCLCPSPELERQILL